MVLCSPYDSYVAYTFHYIIDDDCEFMLKSHLLQVHSFPESYKGKSLMTKGIARAPKEKFENSVGICQR